MRAARHKCNIVKAVARCYLVVVKDASGSYRQASEFKKPEGEGSVDANGFGQSFDL